MNLLLRSGMYPLWLCGGCRYTVLSVAHQECGRCRKGEAPPDVGRIVEDAQRPGKVWDTRKKRQTSR